MATTPTTVVAAIVLTSYDEEVILLRRAPHESYPGLWELPSGKVEEGESISEALARELEEETGLKLDHIRQEVSSFSYEVHGEEREQRNFIVEVSNPGELRLSEEHDRATLAPLWCLPRWEDEVSDEVLSLFEELIASGRVVCV